MLCNLVLLKTSNTEFGDIIIKFTDQNGRPLETEDQVNLKLLIILQNKEQENMLNDGFFFHLQEIFLINIENNYWIWTRFFKNCSQESSPKTREFKGNNMTD